MDPELQALMSMQLTERLLRDLFIHRRLLNFPIIFPKASKFFSFYFARSLRNILVTGILNERICTELRFLQKSDRLHFSMMYPLPTTISSFPAIIHIPSWMSIANGKLEFFYNDKIKLRGRIDGCPIWILDFAAATSAATILRNEEPFMNFKYNFKYNIGNWLVSIMLSLEWTIWGSSVPNYTIVSRS